MGDIEHPTHYVCPQCGCADMRETAKVEALREDLAHYKLGPGVVPADQLRGAVEALTLIAGRNDGIDRATCRQLATDALRAMGVPPTTSGGP